MNAYVASVIDYVKQAHGNEPEFVQTVEEVLSSISPIMDAHPEYEKVDLLKRMVEPERMFTFRVCWMDDKGEYTVRAKNSYGSREEVVLLNVTKVTGDFEPKPLEPMRKAPELPKVEEYEEERSAPKFTFHLRPRLIQKNQLRSLEV